MTKLLPAGRIAAAAELYNDESNMHPARTIAALFGVNERTAQRWVKTAREQGLITRDKVPSNYPRPLVHGTAHGYDQHLCRCTPCRRAWARRQTAIRQRRIARGVIPDHVEHGKDTTYSNWNCRCVPCVRAHSVESRRQREDRKRRCATDAPHGTVSGYDSWGCREDCCRSAKGYKARRV